MLSGPSLGRLLKRDLWGPGKDVMSRGWGCPEPPGQALPYSQGTARAEIRSASPHPPGTSVSPGRSRDHLRAAGGAGRPGSEPPPASPTGEGQAGGGCGGQPGGGRQGQRSGGKREDSLVPRAERRFGLGFESQKRRSWGWGGRAPPPRVEKF